MRAFLSPGERRLLADLERLGHHDEAAFLRALMEELDARLMPEHETPPLRRYRQLTLGELERARRQIEVIAP